ncbi:hypothetical protein ILYODFUR_036859 [Ilyodon furcidens]|uniref:RNA helicase n=1 Tax=Ilyodon furcidens TaxID=33524 RepID=A0ABV0TFD3_9TELE
MIVVSSDKIRVSVQKFLQLPFWVRKFHLARIKPTTLRVSLFVEKAELEPSSQWDCSATLYLHNLLQASTQTEAVIHDLQSESTAIELYLTISNIKWVSGELVPISSGLHRARGRVHPLQVANPSQGNTETYRTNNQAHTH